MTGLKNLQNAVVYRMTQEERIEKQVEIINFVLYRIKPAVFLAFVFGNYFHNLL